MDTDEFSTDAFHGRDWKCAWTEGGGGERSRGEYKRREKGTCACYLLSYPMCVLARPLLYGHQGGRNGAPRVFQAA